MKKPGKTILVFTLSSALLLSSFTAAFAKAAPASKTINGFLMDNKCYSRGVDESGKIDVKKNPQKHLVSCLSMDDCMASGLGVYTKTGTFYKFDKKGSKTADDNIMMMTSKKFNLKVAATGTLKGNTLTLASVKEVK